ncbi:MAG TPA: phosphotransferase [Geobacteraceae bacterium]
MHISAEYLPEHPAFSASVREIESLGFRLSAAPVPGGKPYAVIGGRSNARWWLIPLADRRVAASAMALFQPILPSAKLAKVLGATAASAGLAGVLARKKVYISGECILGDIYGRNDLSYAFFTGTDSPHRKTAVQVMDRDGKIKGFAKVSLNPAVKPLLSHEAEMLNYLRTLDLKTALVPTVLFRGNVDGADVLVTDTLKTAGTKSASTLNGAHIAFLRELAEKTAVPGTDGTDWFVGELRTRFEAVAGRLPEDWQRRLEKAIEVVAGHGRDLGPRSLSHGDFTPWNTFFVDGRLYVFDWEYAQRSHPPGYDLIHFIFSRPERKRPADETIGQIRKTLRKLKRAGDDASADLLFLCYLCGHSLLYINRELETGATVHTWDGEQEAAVIVDALIDVSKFC